MLVFRKIFIYFLKQSRISIELGIREFLRSLIANPITAFQISKWRFQYGGRQIENSIDVSATLYTGVRGVTDYESKNRFSKFTTADS